VAIRSCSAWRSPMGATATLRDAEERGALRRLPPARFEHAYARTSRVPLDGYLRFRQSFYRAPEALVHQRVELKADRDTVWICHLGTPGQPGNLCRFVPIDTSIGGAYSALTRSPPRNL
jgi:hypothetical protein